MTSADSHPLLQEPKPKSSTLKKVGVAAIALSFVLGSIAGTVANGRGVMSLIDPSADTGITDDTAAAPAPAPAQDPAPAPAQEPAQDPAQEPITEVHWPDPDMPKKKSCHHHEYVSVWKSTSASGAQ